MYDHWLNERERVKSESSKTDHPDNHPDDRRLIRFYEWCD